MTDTAGCLGKIGYSKRADAQKARDHFLRRRVGSDSLHVYACDKCSSFHLGRDKRQGSDAVQRKPHESRAFLTKLRRYQDLSRLIKGSS